MTHVKKTAAGLATLGRGDDKMLIHMTPGEVAGLQRLAMAHGGSLTLNPHTGLPEAGFLKNILPVLMGAAAIYATGGAGLAGLGVGGTGALAGAATGALTNKDNRLQGALMGGLGGYTGAGVAGALGSMGQAANQAAVESAASKDWLASQMGAENAMAQQAAAIPQTSYAALPEHAITGPAYGGEVPQSYLNAVNPAPPAGTPLPGQVPELTAYQAPTVNPLSPTESVHRGVQQLGQEGGMKQFGTELGKQYGGTMGKVAAGLGALGAVGAFDQPKLNFAPVPTGSSNAKLSGPIRRPYDPNAPEGYYFTDRGILQPTYAAQGGVIENETEDIGMMAGGGLASFKRGQYLDGPGDGMSDSIPATIGAKQPARLADGEFVIPADVVSHIGNGSSKAGAKRLYAMMDRVRQARTGNKKQGKQINPDKLMPA